jgi:uncharacterized protein YggE
MTSAGHPSLLFGCVMSTIAAVATAHAQPPVPPSVQVIARATVHATPDKAEVDLGVVTRAERSQQASSRNAEKVEGVLATIRPLVGQAGSVRSLAYSVRPEYSHPKGDDEPTITGYTATNIVRVTLLNLTALGGLIDAAIGAGANRVERMRFLLEKETAVRAEALRQAATTARAHADALASALGVRVVRVLAATEEGTPIRPFEAASIARADGATATPIEVGPIEVSAMVTLRVEVASTAAP